MFWTKLRQNNISNDKEGRFVEVNSKYFRMDSAQLQFRLHDKALAGLMSKN